MFYSTLLASIALAATGAQACVEFVAPFEANKVVTGKLFEDSVQVCSFTGWEYIQESPAESYKLDCNEGYAGTVHFGDDGPEKVFWAYTEGTVESARTGSFDIQINCFDYLGLCSTGKVWGTAPECDCQAVGCIGF